MDKIMFLAFLLFYASASGQVQVRDEPRHHNVFENEFVRILDVYLPPGDTSEYHIHKTPSVFTTFTKTATGSQLLNDQPARGVSIAGASWYDSLQITRIHRVWNEDQDWFHVMDIELIVGQPKTHPPVLNIPSLKLYCNEPLVNGYRFGLAPGQKVTIPPSETGYLVLSTGHSELGYQINKRSENRLMQPGHYLWIDSGNQVILEGKGNVAGQFILFQFK